MNPKLKLDFELDYDFLLLGIVSYERDYRLSWDINQKLMFDLARTTDHSLKHKSSGNDQLFSCYIYEDENTYLNYKLLSNHSGEGHLLENLKNMDYFLVVTGEYSSSYARILRDKLVRVESVHNCFILDPEKIKNSHRVI